MPLKQLAGWFQQHYDCQILDKSGRLRAQARRIGQRRVYRTPVAGLLIEKQALREYQVFESKSLHEQRVLNDNWTKFLSGEWTSEVPKEPGMYFVRSRDGVQSVHTLIQLEPGVLHDRDAGFVPPGKVTTWLGSWWSVRVPALSGARL
jgi:hypothetical protein